ncbi:MAG: hypothetical protein R3Y59_04015 [bacterium]
MKKLLLILCVLFQMLPIAAKEYGDNIHQESVRYVVNCKALNVRKSPVSGSVMFTVRNGDYLYGKMDASNWLKINGGDWYVSSKYLIAQDNPNFGQGASDDTEDAVDIAFTYKIQTIVRWCLLGVCIIILFFMFRLKWGYFKNIFQHAGDCENGMHRKFYYDKQTYGAVIMCVGLILGTILAGVLALLLVGGTAWLIMAIFWVILWAIIIIGWILAVGGSLGAVLGFVSKEFEIILPSIPCAIGGFVILNYQDTLSELGNTALNNGFTFLKHMYIVDFVRDLFIIYWKPAVIIVAIPIVIFAALVLINLIVSWIFMLVEYIVMSRYNIKNPCPVCQHASEPAIYLSEGEELPVKLHPGKYGVFNVLHPTTKAKMPTMLFNGKGKLSRKCKCCGAIISADMGTERHIALAGVAESGKTTLVYRMIASMFNKYPDKISFTGDLNNKIKTYIKNVSKAGYINDFPDKTPVGQMRSIQLKILRNVGVDYRLYINDVGGELYNMSSVDVNEAKQIAQFVRNMNTIVFIIDPMTIDFTDFDVSDEFGKWATKNQTDNIVKINIADAFSRLKHLMESQQLSSKAIRKINMNVVLVKKDMGYIPEEVANDQSLIKSFLQSEMGLHRLVNDIETTFNSKHISYIAVSAIRKDTDSVDCGNVDKLASRLLSQLGIEPQK